jgi:glutamyl-tRNA synthetase
VFHLGNVVDDITMNITHVIRGDDHVENTFRHLALFRALGAPLPQYAHLPMIVNAQGKPYSKRDGAAYVGDFKTQGLEADALFNYVALVGWSPGEDREFMTRDEMIKLFTLERVQSKAGQFDLKKLAKMNVWYLQQAPQTVWAQQFDAAFPGASSRPDFDAILALMKPRIRTWKELPAAVYFFADDFPIDAAAREKVLGTPGAQELVAAAREALTALATFDAPAIEAALCAIADTRGLKHVDVKQPVRVAVTGTAGGPDLAQIIAILGRERALKRIA